MGIEAVGAAGLDAAASVHFRRRAALGRLAAVGLFGALAEPAPAWSGPGAAAAPHAVPLAWGPGGVWAAGREGPSLQALEGAAGVGDVSTVPVATARGVWGLSSSRVWSLWRASGDGGWSAAQRFEAPVPVHGAAASADGRWALLAHGEQLSLLDAQARLVRRYDGTDLARRRHGPARALWHLPQRRSFVVAWPALGELWEIPLDPHAEPIFDGLVHDYRLGEGIASPGYLGVRRTPLGLPMPDLAFADAQVPWLAGLQDERVVVVHLDVRRRVAERVLPGARPQAALVRRTEGGLQWWLPCGQQVQVLDVPRFVPVGRYALPAPARALHAVGAAVWALLADADTAALWIWDGRPWRPLGGGSGIPGVPRAMVVEPGGTRVLLATEQPAAVHLLGADGALHRNWPLPAGADPRGVAWLPASA